MKRIFLAMTTLCFVLLTLSVPNTYSIEVNENNAPLNELVPTTPMSAKAGEPITKVSDEGFVFPATGDTRFNLLGNNFWNAGDFVEGTRAFAISFSSVDITLVLENNFLSCDTQDHHLMIDGTTVGSFSVNAGDTQVVKTFDFPVITAGNHTIRIVTARTVSSACASAGFADDLSTLYYSFPSFLPAIFPLLLTPAN